MKYSAYLDIETTSLSPNTGELTVIGLYLEDGKNNGVMQFVGDEICSSKLFEIINNVKVLYTYNGERFDLPFISKKLNVDLTEYCQHRDLMYECWKRNLYGGLKMVERTLGITRKSNEIDGRIAVQLWYNYKFNGDKEALTMLLEYNKEDVLNLIELRKKLNI